MEKITKEIVDQAIAIGDKNIDKLFDLFFQVTTAEGYTNWELETWTNGGVDMIISLYEENKALEFINWVKHFDIDDEISLHRQSEIYCKDFKIRESVEDFAEFKEWLEAVCSIISDIYFGIPLPKINDEPVKHTATVICGGECVDYYRANEEIPTKEFAKDNEGKVFAVSFDTEAELLAYIQAANDLYGWCMNEVAIA